MLQRVVTLAAESLKLLERQLMDGGQIQDVKVGSEPLAHPSWPMMRRSIPRLCVGGHAASSGRVRCFDSPGPQASPSAQPGCGPPHLQLQQGRRQRRRKPSRRGAARHRLQPSVPLPGGAQSESRRLAWKRSVFPPTPHSRHHWLSGRLWRASALLLWSARWNGDRSVMESKGLRSSSL